MGIKIEKVPVPMTPAGRHKRAAFVDGHKITVEISLDEPVPVTEYDAVFLELIKGECASLFGGDGDLTVLGPDRFQWTPKAKSG